MSTVWAVIAATALALIVYGIVSSKRAAVRRREEREKVLPNVEASFANGTRYEVRLSDGRCFKDVEILGLTDPEGQSPLGSWQGLLAVRLDDGRKAWLRPASIRYVVEALLPHAA